MGMYDDVRVRAGTRVLGAQLVEPAECQTKDMACNMDQYVLDNGGLFYGGERKNWTGIMHLYDGERWDFFASIINGHLIDTYESAIEAAEADNEAAEFDDAKADDWAMRFVTKLADLEVVVEQYLNVRRGQTKRDIPKFTLRVTFDTELRGRFSVRMWLVSDEVGLYGWRSRWPSEAEVWNNRHSIEDLLCFMVRECGEHSVTDEIRDLAVSTLMVYRELRLPDILTRDEARVLIEALRSLNEIKQFRVVFDDERRLA